ncbi:LysR family transcriptional regulator [Novosphingobium kunmingense]|uniref:LysR family transcriptional regulator n=1 Tax=Novosphingobium kunmingense TaxID=1211806 RepID=A0A2N0H3M0_9SPHN|nr:LysR family transcriptional regulator [Novosphingobium kunmingense]PKB13519.1 LysR family transcriptional regulator [Novosphingobium kunmingense]
MQRNPSLHSLRLFIQVAHSLSFSETARQANLSQPALSRTIRLLEEDLGVRLFDRNSRNVTLTPAGAALLPTVERLSTDFDQAFRELTQTFQGLKGRVLVGALPSMSANLLPKVIAEFRKTRPLVEVIIRENLSEGLLQSLHERMIDFAITTPPADLSGIQFTPLIKDDYILVCRPKDLDDIPDPAPWSIFAKRHSISMEARSSVRILTDAAFARAGVVANRQYECTLLATAGGFISAGLGIALMPRSTLPLLAVGGPIAWRAMAKPHEARQIGICTLSARSLSPAAQNFIEAVEAMAINAEN